MNTWLLACLVYPFLLLGLVDLALPSPPAVRYLQLTLSTGLCLGVVALVAHAGLLAAS